MTDDIVTRLRDIASLRGNMNGSVIPVACNEAADEIQRLQEQIDYLRDNIDMLLRESINAQNEISELKNSPLTTKPITDE